MKIFFDHLAFNQTFGGVPKYFVEVIKRLERLEYTNVILSVNFSNNIFLKQIRPKIKSFFPQHTFKGKPKIERVIGDLLSIARLIFIRKIDVYHATHYSNYARFFLSSKTKFVSTIHDMNNWTVPQFYPKYNVRQMRQALQMKKCDHIIAISNQTRKDILKFYPEYRDKISVIYHGIDPQLKEEKETIQNLPNEFILFVGERMDYKNFKGLLRAFIKLNKENKRLHLICVGKKFNKEEQELLNSLEVAQVIKNFQASDGELRYLYSKASLFVFPSYYEGFGLPCLEAMQMECVMALSDNSVFPEICGSAAVYFNPYDDDSIYEVCKKALYQFELRDELKGRMKKRLSTFTWEKSAKLHLKVYQEIRK